MSKESRIEEIGRVWTKEARLLTPIRDVEVAFAFPIFGAGNYDIVVNQVLDAKQRLPTGEQTAFMLDDAYNSGDIKDNPRAESVRNIMNNGWLWVPSVNVLTPKNVKNPGMYSVFDEEGKGLSKQYDVNELEDILSGGSIERGVRFSKDMKVAFAPQNTIRAGKHDKGTLAYDGAYIAVYGVEGAEKLDKVANNFRFNPYSWVPINNTNTNIQTLSALCRGRDLGGNRLGAVFDSGSDDWDGYVVSVSGSRPTTRGNAPKK